MHTQNSFPVVKHLFSWMHREFLSYGTRGGGGGGGGGGGSSIPWSERNSLIPLTYAMVI